MRTLVKLSVFCLTSGAVALFSGNLANAADQNTYRPGTPYLKTVANHFGQCEQQCRGDAACRSWNFVRPNAGTASGICEFNSRMVNPVSSTVSMSGAMNTSVDPLMSRAVATNNNGHTIRVGTPTITRSARPQNKRRQASTNRKTVVKRQPVPQQRTPQRANHTRPTTQKQQNVRRPQLTPQQARYRQQYLEQKKYQAEMQRQQQVWQQQNVQRAPQNVGTQRQTPQKQAQMQVPMQTPTQRPIQASRPQPQQTVQQQRPQGLYGSLHDDLTQNMSIVPRPQTAPDNLNNPDAPVSTSRAIPTIPVQETPMKDMSLSGLAGG